MAHYKDASFLVHNGGTDFDQNHPPGQAAPFAGIYRCMSCGIEVGIAYGHTLPPPSHHAHPKPILWRLIVWADHNPK